MVIGLCFIFTNIAWSQNRYSEHTLKLNDQADPPVARIVEMAWLAGHWKGEGLGGISEEVWSPPAAGSMMGVYRSIRDGKVQFYEIVTIVEEKNTLVLRLKHFDKDLHGWEEKEETVDFPLVKMNPNIAYFDGFTIERVDDANMRIYVVIGQKGEEPKEAEFVYTRLN